MVRRRNLGRVRQPGHSREHCPDNHRRRKRRHSFAVVAVAGAREKSLRENSRSCSYATTPPITAGRGAYNYRNRFGERRRCICCGVTTHSLGLALHVESGPGGASKRSVGRRQARLFIAARGKEAATHGDDASSWLRARCARGL